MGVDIYSVLEVREADGRWVSVGDREDEPIRGRNYLLFAMLADVRNDREERIVPISQPRGVPADASERYRSWTDDAKDYAFRHSYLTLADLLAYDFMETRWEEGLVSLDDFAAWDAFARHRGRRPDVAWSIVAADGKTVLDDDKAQDLVRSGRRSKGSHPNTFVRCSWTQTYADLAGEFLTYTIPKMLSESIRRKIGHADVRICFFFDS